MSESNVKILCDKSLIDNIGNAIRNKTGSEEKMTIVQLATGAELRGDPKLQDKTVDPTTSVQSIKADSDYDGLDTVTVNAMPTATQATPAITVDPSGLITATAMQTAGYVTAGRKTATEQLAFQAAKTITPGTIDQVAVAANYFTGGAVTVQGDSNLVGENIVKGKSIFGVDGTHECSGGGDTDIEDAIVDGTITEYTNDRVKSIASYAFYSCSSLTIASFPVCTTIGENAFYSCTSLTSVSFPVCITIGNNAFHNCFSLTIASFPVCTTISGAAFNNCSSLTIASFPVCITIGNNAFAYCSSLTTVSFPACTSIGSFAFFSCRSLTIASFPVCTTIASYAFSNCSSLTIANFPVCTTISNSAFYSCIGLTSVSFPVCTSIGGYAFNNCRSLTSVSFPVCTSIASYVFRSCYKLLSLYLAASTVCTLKNSNAFSSTPIAGYTTSTNGVLGSIFVPASLVDAYKTATNWTYFADRIAAIPT